MRSQRFQCRNNTSTIAILVSIFSLILLLSIAVSHVKAADRQTGARRIDTSGKFKSPCGSSAQVADRIGRCMDVIFELIYGKYDYPKDDADLAKHCERFAEAEKCVRNTAKECLTGLPKTATGAVASATRRFRTQECKTQASRARYMEPLKCAIRNGNEMKAMYNNYTGISQAIRDLPGESPEGKLMKGCCMLIALDKSIEASYNKVCPDSTAAVLSIVHAMTDDARSTLCVAPKCNKALDKVVNARYKGPQNLIEPIMQIHGY